MVFKPTAEEVQHTVARRLNMAPSLESNTAMKLTDCVKDGLPANASASSNGNRRGQLATRLRIGAELIFQAGAIPYE